MWFNEQCWWRNLRYIWNLVSLLVSRRHTGRELVLFIGGFALSSESLWIGDRFAHWRGMSDLLVAAAAVDGQAPPRDLAAVSIQQSNVGLLLTPCIIGLQFLLLVFLSCVALSAPGCAGLMWGLRSLERSQDCLVACTVYWDILMGEINFFLCLFTGFVSRFPDLNCGFHSCEWYLVNDK